MSVKAALRWLKAKLVRSGELGSTEANTSGPVPEEPFVNQTEFEEWCWDDVNGGWLGPEKVREARKLEMEYLKKQAVYQKRPASEAFKVTGRRPIPARWLDTDKGDPTQPSFRSRLVVKDIKAAKSESEQLPQNLLFSSTPGDKAEARIVGHQQCTPVTAFRKGPSTSNYRMRMRRARYLVRRSVVY